MRRHLLCSTVAARARFVAESSREQRKARAPTVKSLSGICDLEPDEAMRFAMTAASAF